MNILSVYSSELLLLIGEVSVSEHFEDFQDPHPGS